MRKISLILAKIRKKDVLLQPQMTKYRSFKSWGSRIVAIATDCKSVRVSVRWFESTLPHFQENMMEKR